MANKRSNNKFKKTTTSQRLISKSQQECEMLAELRDLLVCFEFVTNELQSNKVSISRVYPCYLFLKKRLSEDLYKYPFTKLIREKLLISLEKRFGSLIHDNDIFITSTLLDPNFGKRAVPLDNREIAVAKLKFRYSFKINFKGFLSL